MFGGTSCFPLSPCNEMKMAKNQDVNIVSSKDQLKLILDIRGHKDEDDISFITQDSVLDYHKSLNTKTSKVNFKDLFPLTSDYFLKSQHWDSIGFQL